MFRALGEFRQISGSEWAELRGVQRGILRNSRLRGDGNSDGGRDGDRQGSNKTPGPPVCL